MMTKRTHDWRSFARLVLLSICVTCSGCSTSHRSTLYPEGYTPRGWIVVVNGHWFLAHHVTEEDIDTTYVGADVTLLPVPTSSHWRSIDDLEAFESKHWREVGTQLFVQPISEEEPELRNVLRFANGRGIFAMSVKSIDTRPRSELVEKFLQSLPDKPTAQKPA